MKLRVNWSKVVYNYQGDYGGTYKATTYRRVGDNRGLTNIISETECCGTILNDTPILDREDVCFVVLLDDGSTFEVLPVHILTVIGY